MPDMLAYERVLKVWDTELQLPWVGQHAHGATDSLMIHKHYDSYLPSLSVSDKAIFIWDDQRCYHYIIRFVCDNTTDLETSAFHAESEQNILGCVPGDKL